MTDATEETPPAEPVVKAKAATTKTKSSPKKRSHHKKKEPKKLAIPRPYPVVSYREATTIGDAIFKFASGERVRRLTLLEKLERNPNSSATRMLITNSSKYAITTGSYAAEFFDLTETGYIACNPDSNQRDKLTAQFKLVINGILPFKVLYDTYVGKKLPAHEVMKDRLLDSKVELDDPKECIDLFGSVQFFVALCRMARL